MAGTNEYLEFCPVDTGTNLPTQAAYLADTDRTNGNQPGIASSKLNNKALRQATFVASMLAQYMANVTNQNVLDDGDETAFLSTLGAALTSGYNIQSKTANYGAAIKDYVICSGAAFTVTLPDATVASSKGLSIIIKHNGSNFVGYTLLTTSGQTIGGVASGSYILYTTGETIQVTSDGSNWVVTGRVTNNGEINAGAIYVSSTSSYVFTVTAASATVGATYSNNGFIYTVTTTIAGGVTLTCSGTGTPATSGTLTKVSGTGDATITFASRTITGVPVKGATPTVDQFIWTRVGRFAECNYMYAGAATGTAGVGDYVFTLPFTVDTTNIVLYTTISNQPSMTNEFGSMFSSQTSNSLAYSGKASMYSATQFRLYGLNVQAGAVDNATNWSAIGSAALNNFSGANFRVNATFRIPISGWQP